MGEVTRERGGFYIWPSPDRSTRQRFWGVTTIIDKGVPKAALKFWAAKMTAEWAVDNIVSVQTLLGRASKREHRQIPAEAIYGLLAGTNEIDPRQLGNFAESFMTETFDPAEFEKAREEAIDLAKNAHRRTTARAALKGTHVHRAIEAYHLGKPFPGVPDEVRAQYDEFLRFLNDHRPIVEHTEANVFNRKVMYAGTLDATMLMPSLATAISRAGLWAPSEESPHPRVILDVKTTGSGVWPEVGMQLAAYKNAEFIAGPDGSEHPMPEVHAAVVLWLPAGGEYELLPISVGDEVYRAFLFAYEILRWFEETSKPVVGRALPRPHLADPEAEFERLRVMERDDLRALTRSRRLSSVDDVLDAMTGDELALAIVWDRLTPPEVEFYRPTRPCPCCGWQVEEVKQRNGSIPKWRCENDGCTGGGERKGRLWPWASWHSTWEKALAEDGPKVPGQTSHLKPIVGEVLAEKAAEVAEAAKRKPNHEQIVANLRAEGLDAEADAHEAAFVNPAASNEGGKPEPEPETPENETAEQGALGLPETTRESA